MATTALVFDRMSPASSAYAREAALKYIDENIRSDSSMSVYVTGLSLSLVQPFTADVQLLRAAVERASLLSTTSNPSDFPDLKTIRDEVTELSQSEIGPPFRQETPLEEIGS